MDTLTHALVGALVGRSCPAGDSGISARQRTIVGAISAAFPDIDYLTFWIDPLTFLSDWHRGPTHSLVLLPVWALLLGLFWSRVFGRPQASRQLILIVALVLGSHILTDLITVYGTAVFYPLSDWRPGFGMTFVIDPWLTVPLAMVLFVSLLRRDMRLARAGLVLLMGVLGVHALLQRGAEHVGRDYAIAQGLDPEAVRAIAQPLSPLHWKIVVPDADGYHMAHIRLTERAGFPPAWAEWLGVAELLAAYGTENAASWQSYVLFGESRDDEPVRAVWQHPLLERFRRFAALPALYRIDRSTSRFCVWFTDLRYTIPSLIPAFRYGLCRSDRKSPWQLYRIRRFTDSDIETV